MLHNFYGVFGETKATQVTADDLCYLVASCSHQLFHIVWKQTRVPSLSNITRPGLKAAILASEAWLSSMDGDTTELNIFRLRVWAPARDSSYSFSVNST